MFSTSHMKKKLILIFDRLLLPSLGFDHHSKPVKKFGAFCLLSVAIYARASYLNICMADHPSEKAWDCTCHLLLSWSWRSHKRFRRKRLWYINFRPFQTHLSLSLFSRGDIHIYFICDVTYEILSNSNPFSTGTPLTISACSLLFWVETNVVA